MGEIFLLVVGAVKILIDLNCDFYGQGLSVIIDGDFHPPFFHSEFFEKI